MGCPFRSLALMPHISFMTLHDSSGGAYRLPAVLQHIIAGPVSCSDAHAAMCRLAAQAAVVELIEEQGLPPVCAALAVQEDADQQLGRVLAQAVQVSPPSCIEHLLLYLLSDCLLNRKTCFLIAFLDTLSSSPPSCFAS